MYPDLYYVFKDWFGVEWKSLSILHMFGLMVAVSFIIAAVVLTAELKRREKMGLLSPREEVITVGKPAALSELLINALIGFIFGFKVIGLLMNRPDDMDPQSYIFSREGNLLGGLALAALLAGYKWYEKNKQKLKEPERRNVRIWPHDRVGDLVILGLLFGILGAKVFDGLENWDEFVKDPIGRLFSQSGLTFYGGLITAAVVICWYAAKRGIKIIHLVDSAAPALMIAYAVGRIGCQVAGDGDWGVYNSAYVNDEANPVKVRLANEGDFNRVLQKDSTYFINGKLPDVMEYNGRTSKDLAHVPHIYFKGPSWLPNWMFAYSYPKNVNADGVLIPGDNDQHNRVLPTPVFPTPFYETVACLLLFLFLWLIRKRIKTPGVIFGIYLILNGLERFFVEKIRVNTTYTLFGYHPTQAEIISFLLFVSGIILVLYQRKFTKSN
ncbi:MAG: prolipoprotein diacylglyceryl transferase [Bacteroidetes bacterium]|nr:prolipoprotein diacylglyceryl transferase [Bacteroidota bacterium]